MCPRLHASFEPPPDRQGGPFEFGGDAPGDLMRGMRQVEQPIGAELQVAAPPLAEPAVGAAQRTTDLRHGLTRQASLDRVMTIRVLVSHGWLPSLAAGGCQGKQL